MRRHFDLGRLAVALALLILLIFGADFLRRAVVGLFQDRPSLAVPGNSSASATDSASVAVPGANSQSDSAVDSGSTASGTDPGAYDMEKYQTVSKSASEVGIGSLVLVDGSHGYTGAGAQKLTGFNGVKNESFRLKSFDVQVHPDLITPLNDMFLACQQATGLKNVMLYSTHQTYAGGMYAQNVPERPTGYCVDLALLQDGGAIATFTGEGKYSWLLSNCANYGFVQRYPADKKEKTGMDGESWHFRYVGAPHALLMKQNNLCLEEYLTWLKDYTVSGNHAAVTVGATYYEVYYVPAVADGATAVPVPKTGEYTVSGNNVDGFVVAMQVAIT